MLTQPEIDAEFKYRVEERLAILCGADKPTPEQIRIANREAFEAVKKLKEKEN